MPILSLKNVSYTYPGGFLAVDNVSIDIEKNERAAIIGQNGAGKTTTVKMCNGLLRPAAGSVSVEGADTKNRTTALISRTVGYVFQNPDDQIFHSTVRSEVEFGPKMMKYPKERIGELVDYALKITGMYGARNENPYCLPLSVRKFVTIASVIAMDAKIMIFDEPTAGQDLNGTRRLSELIKELGANGKTIIIISHDMEFVAENFPRIIVMADKKVIADGAPKDIFWNFPVLAAAKLSQPHISKLCGELKLGGNIVEIKEAADAAAVYNKKRKDGSYVKQ